MRAIVLLVFTLCSCAPRTGPHKPLVGADQSVGYEMVRPLFAKYCAACHPSRSGPDWLIYQQAEPMALNGRLVQRVLIDRSMPPAQSAESAAIDEKDRRLIAQWAKSGAPLLSRGKPDPDEMAVQTCLHCHGVDGPGSEAKAPRLAGQNEDYLVQQLIRFKWRERVDPTDKMNEAAFSLSDEMIRKVAHFFASKPAFTGDRPPLPPDQQRLLYSGRKLANLVCNSCHMNPGPWLPVLRYQSRLYLMNQLLYFRSDERRSPLMHQFVINLSHEDLEAVALYYAVGD